MKIVEEKSCLIITRKYKWSPWGAVIYGAIAGTFIGFANDEVKAGVVVFFMVAIIGMAITLQERITRFETLVIDFEKKTIRGYNQFLNWNLKPLKIDNFDINLFYFSTHDFREKFHHTYWINYKKDKKYELFYLLGEESKDKVTAIFKNFGKEPFLR